MKDCALGIHSADLHFRSIRTPLRSLLSTIIQNLNYTHSLSLQPLQPTRIELYSTHTKMAEPSDSLDRHGVNLHEVEEQVINPDPQHPTGMVSDRPLANVIGFKDPFGRTSCGKNELEHYHLRSLGLAVLAKNTRATEAKIPRNIRELENWNTQCMVVYTGRLHMRETSCLSEELHCTRPCVVGCTLKKSSTR